MALIVKCFKKHGVSNGDLLQILHSFNFYIHPNSIKIGLLTYPAQLALLPINRDNQLARKVVIQKAIGLCMLPLCAQLKINAAFLLNNTFHIVAKNLNSDFQSVAATVVLYFGEANIKLMLERCNKPKEQQDNV